MDVFQQAWKFVTANWIWFVAGAVVLAIIVTLIIVCSVKKAKKNKEEAAELQKRREKGDSRADEMLAVLKALDETQREQMQALEKMAQAVKEIEEKMGAINTAKPNGATVTEMREVSISQEGVKCKIDELKADIAASYELLNGSGEEEESAHTEEVFVFKPAPAVYDLTKLQPTEATAEPSEEGNSELDDILGRIDDAIAERKSKRAE